MERCQDSMPAADVATTTGDADVYSAAAAGAVSIPNDIARYHALGILDTLLKDCSTDGNIVWGTTSYEALGAGFAAADEIAIAQIVDEHPGIIRRRAMKDKDEKSSLTRTHAEVFTPTWICKQMIDDIDDDFAQRTANLKDDTRWKRYALSTRLEITCGEAPFIVNRYDAATGEPIAVANRTGILDRKLHRIAVHTSRRHDWMRWAAKALQATYGYEFQGDNLLIARINVLATIEDHLGNLGYKPLNAEEYQTLSDIISWNFWQMDGLSRTVPFGQLQPQPVQASLFDDPPEDDVGGQPASPARGAAVVRNWETGETIEFRNITRGGTAMRFDYIIGNPPYQEETDNNGRQQPIYSSFMDASFELSDVVELITPARFLFDAGQTLKSWNEKMLNDVHFKVLFYEPDSSKLFPDTDIKGGVAITLRDGKKEFGAIDVFTPYPLLNSMALKVNEAEGDLDRLDSLFASQRLYKFSEKFFIDHSDDPNAKFFLGTGTRNKILSSAMEKMPEVFKTEPESTDQYVRLLGRIGSKRQYRYIKRVYIKHNEYIDAYKVFIPEANNSGSFGETLAEPIIGEPGTGSTDTFLNAGPFKTEIEAKNLSKYYKTKFFRALLGIRKVTQHSPAPVWKSIPLQDFTSSSDIDWSQSAAEIDVQLYKKYGLSPDEIDFIETHVQEMK